MEETLNTTLLNDMEKDVIGEVMNISLGSSATSLSSLFSRRVDITVPFVEVLSAQDLEFKELEPAVGVEIKYTKGIKGNNILVLKKSDIKTILEILMGTEIPDEEFELDEIAMSAVSEVMNQMMGSAATAMADFINQSVDISTPVAYEIIDRNDFMGRYFADSETLVKVKFNLKIDELIDSEFINIFPIALAKELVNMFLKGTGMDMGDNGEIISNNTSASAELPEVKDQNSSTGNSEGGNMSPEEIEALLRETKEVAESAPEKTEPARQKAIDEDYETQRLEMANHRPKKKRRPVYEEEYEYEDEEDEDDYYEPPVRRRPAPKKQQRFAAPVNVAPMEYESFDEEEENLSEEQKTNLGLIMSVPLQITVEIGRTKRKIKEILEFSQGTVVELDKQAGAHVDIIINGQTIAKGDVVVVNDNFGVRVTEILKKEELVKLTT